MNLNNKMPANITIAQESQDGSDGEDTLLTSVDTTDLSVIRQLIAMGTIPVEESSSTGTTEVSATQKKAAEERASSGPGEKDTPPLQSPRPQQAVPQSIKSGEANHELITPDLVGALEDVVPLGHTHGRDERAELPAVGWELDFDDHGIPGAYAEGGIGGDRRDTSESNHDQEATESNANIPNAVPVTDDLEVAEPVVMQAESDTAATKIPLLLLLLLLALVVPTVVLTQDKSTNGEEADHSVIASSPSAIDDNEFIIDLPNYTRRAILGDPTSPQMLAYEWLQNDPNLLTYSETKKTQRFVLAVLYYSTDGDKWMTNRNWLEYDTDECHDWYNLAGRQPFSYDFCTADGNFQGLALFHNSMRGTIPRELGLLTKLHGLAFTDSSLSGTIPMEVWLLPELKLVALSRNKLSGTIPQAGLSASQNIRVYMDLADNKLSGTLPTEVGLMHGIEYLSLGDNRLFGTLPSELGALSTLEYLGIQANAFGGALPPSTFQGFGSVTDVLLRDNLFTGTLPTEIGLLTNLQRMYIYMNYFSGSLPSEIGRLTDLLVLNVGNNKFSGIIPYELWHLSDLEEFQIRANYLSGSIPSDCGATLGVESMILFDVRWNLLTDIIPSSVGLWTSLEKLRLRENDFDGSLPPEVWKLTKMKRMSVGNDLTGSIPYDLHLPDIEYFNLSTSLVSGTIPDHICSAEFVDFSCSEFLCGCDCPC